MRSFVTFFMIVMFTSSVYGELIRTEISEDGKDTVNFCADQTTPVLTQTNDIVPYGNQPDWTCGLRYQVGGLVIDDLNGDGNPDLVVGNYHSESYPPYPDWRNFILYNTGSELESTPFWWSDDSSSTTDVRIADFNNDGLPDIFACNGDFSMQPSCIYFHNSFDDSIQTQPGWFANDNTWTLCAAPFDFDDDGDIDVATANQGVYPYSYRPVYIFVNHNGSLETTPSWSSADNAISGYIAWGDYDGDGWYDLAVSKWVNFYSCVYRNNAGTVGTSPVWIADNESYQKGVGWSDIDGDGFPELAIGGTSSQPSQLYPNNSGTLGDSPIWESENSSHGCQDLAWADVDGDGDEDLATVHFSNGHLRIYLNVDGQLEQTPSWQYDASSVGTALTFGDINGDGGLDLVMGVSGEPCVMVFYNNMTSVDDKKIIPDKTFLAKNYPNPFNMMTRISFYMDKTSAVEIKVYDIRGRSITALTGGVYQKGYHSVTWNGTNSNGRHVTSGIYFYQLLTEDQAFTERMVLLK